MTFTLSGDDRVVAVGAHPDNLERMCYGLLRCWQEAGATVTAVAVTDGTNGVSRRDSAAGVRVNPQQRPAESARAFQGTGIAVECLGMVDGALTPDIRLISTLENVLIRLGCTALVTHALHNGNDHQDHHAIAPHSTPQHACRPARRSSTASRTPLTTRPTRRC